MVKFTYEMREMIAKVKVMALATATKEGNPNVVPVSFTRVISDDEILLMDNYMNKTRANLDTNPLVALSVWDLDKHMGYQFKGKVRIETSGELFKQGLQWVKERRPKATPRAAIVVSVAEIYLVGSDANAGTRIQ